VYEFKLPDLGEGIHEGEILKWHVEVGDRIEEDAPLVDVETDKAAVTIPSPRAGTITSLGGGEGDTINVGQVIAVIDDGSGAGTVAPTMSVVSATADVLSMPGVSAARKVAAAPATRRLARELGVDIAQISGSGPAGRVTPGDVRALAAGGPDAGSAPAPRSATAPAPTASSIPFLDIEPLPDFTQWGPVEKEPLRSIRRKVAHRMVTSMILVPHVAHMDEADVTELEAFRKREKEKRGEQPGGHLTLLPFVVKAVTAGLRAAPAFNASLDPFGEEMIYKRYYNVGVAVDTGRGLMVPVVKETDRKSIIQLSADIEDLANRAREGKVTVDELRGGTFTITNVGPIGGTALIPTINYPEVAILGMGRVQEKPVVRDGEIVVRKLLPLTLAFDHRVADGADAARFVTELVRQLSDPNLLLLET